MTQKTAIRKRPVPPLLLHSEAILSAQDRTSGGFTAWLESATQEILVVTYWFDPSPRPEPSSVTVRFSGHRVDVKGRLSARDRFVQDETIEKVVPGSGPISLTARIRGIAAGTWSVSASPLPIAHAGRGKEKQVNMTSPNHRPAMARWWRRWAPPVSPEEPMRTGLELFARVPGMLPGMWG